LPPLGEETITSEDTIHQRQEMLMAVDEGLGRIVAAIDALGELDNTVVVVTSDHGYWYGEHGLSAERRLAYEEALRIPMMIRYPAKITAGSRPGETVLSLDIAPTMLEFAGVPVPANLHGLSLLPVVENTVSDWRSSFLIEYYSDTVFTRIVTMGYKAVRTDQYKYIQYVDLEGMDELYDLAQDPYELINVIDNERYEKTLQEMRTELARLLEITS
jgi:N-acetylglucosamine-6-sulfatase